MLRLRDQLREVQDRGQAVADALLLANLQEDQSSPATLDAACMEDLHDLQAQMVGFR
jgi:hypothetical protein